MSNLIHPRNPMEGKGPISKGEKVGDFLLKFPSKMWGMKKVRLLTIPKGEDSRKITFEMQNKRNMTKGMGSLMNAVWTDWTTWGDPLAAIVVTAVTGPVFLLANVAAAPLYGAGLAIKKIAVNKDPEAKEYYKMLDGALHPDRKRYYRSEAAIKRCEEEIGKIKEEIRILKNPDSSSDKDIQNIPEVVLKARKAKAEKKMTDDVKVLEKKIHKLEKSVTDYKKQMHHIESKGSLKHGGKDGIVHEFEGKKMPSSSKLKRAEDIIGSSQKKADKLEKTIIPSLERFISDDKTAKTKIIERKFNKLKSAKKSLESLNELIPTLKQKLEEMKKGIPERSV